MYIVHVALTYSNNFTKHIPTYYQDVQESIQAFWLESIATYVIHLFKVWYRARKVCILYSLCYVCTACRLGDIVKVVGIVGYPFQLTQRSESLAHAMLRFGSGKTAVLHCHYNDIPMYPIPFFQIFGDKVYKPCRPPCNKYN